MLSRIKSGMKHFRLPAGLADRLVVWSMRCGHDTVSSWGAGHHHFTPDARILDIGCGNGASIRRFLELCPGGRVCGVDPSGLCVARSRSLNARAVAEGRCEVRQGDVAGLPWADNSFDGVTAFETIYFWPNIIRSFKEVRRVLKPGGLFLICNERSDPHAAWQERIDGMTIYSREELRSFMKGSGFSQLEDDQSGEGRVCVMARKMTEGLAA